MRNLRAPSVRTRPTAGIAPIQERAKQAEGALGGALGLMRTEAAGENSFCSACFDARGRHNEENRCGGALQIGTGLIRISFAPVPPPPLTRVNNLFVSIRPMEWPANEMINNAKGRGGDGEGRR